LPHAKRLSGYEDAYINMFLPKYNSVQTWGLSEPERRIFKKCSSKEEAVKLIFERRKEFMEKHSGKLGNSLPKP
jgi:hypothetical protein